MPYLPIPPIMTIEPPLFDDGYETSTIKKTYLMAQFLQRPDERFEFDHVIWEVVYRSIPHPAETGLTIQFKATTEGILGLYNCYTHFNVPEEYDWNRCVELAEPIVLQDERYGPTMARIIRQHGPDQQYWPTAVGTIPQVNWGRDGF